MEGKVASWLVENKETKTQVKDDLYYENLILAEIKRGKVDGIADLFLHFNSISKQHFSSPSFINKLEESLFEPITDEKLSTSSPIPLINLVQNNIPSYTLILLKYLNGKGVDIFKKLISNPQMRFSLITSSLLLCDKIDEKIIMLINKKDKIAQLELVKIFINNNINYNKNINNINNNRDNYNNNNENYINENNNLNNNNDHSSSLLLLSLFDIKGEEENRIKREKMMMEALLSFNIKIIKYFHSLNFFDFKNNFNIPNFDSINGLHFILQPVNSYIHNNNINNHNNNYYKNKKKFYNYLHNIFYVNNKNINNNNNSINNFIKLIEKEKEKSILKIIKFNIEKGANIHQINNGKNLLHIATKYHSLNIIKYLISLGVDFHSLDDGNNNVLLLAINREEEKNNLENHWKKVEKIMRYFISIGVNVEQKNNIGLDLFLYLLKNKYKNNPSYFNFIQFISSQLFKFDQNYNFTSISLQHSIYNLLLSFDLKMIKFANQFSSFSNYFDGENKIKSKNSILSQLINFYISKPDQISLTNFQETFNFFLHKRNNINNIDKYNRISIHQNYNNVFIPWKFFDYLIEKGINLNHVSNSGSILHFILYYNKEKNNQDLAKYIMIRSMEINLHIVDHPRFNSLDDEATFDNFIRKDENEEGREEEGEKF